MQHDVGSRRSIRRLGLSLVWAAGLMMAALPASAIAGSLSGRTIVIDPGHGGIDGGATAFGRVEKNLTLPISLDLSALLRGAGARVILTRSSDAYVSLANRSAIANAAGADAFVSIHGNALSDPSYSGVTTYYGPSSGYVTGVTRSVGLVTGSRALALDVQAAARARTGAVDRGVQPANYWVLGNARMPAILIETGFITNPAEGQRLATPGYQEALAAGIANGLARFAANPSQTQPAATVTAPNAGTSAAATATGRYIVRPGDTLSAIAVRFGVSEAALRSANALSNADVIFAGRPLALPTTTAPLSASTGSTGATDSVAPPPKSAGTRTYAVQYGDTLSAVAVRFGISEAALRAANALANGDLIYAGQTLTVSGGGAPPAATASAAPASDAGSQGASTYTVQPGDTLSSIARRFGVSETRLVQTNGVTNANAVFAGQTLQLSSGGQVSFGTERPQAALSAGAVRRYLVRPGDTLSGIALRLGIGERALAAVNQLTNTNHLVAGGYLRLPALVPATAPAN